MHPECRRPDYLPMLTDQELISFTEAVFNRHAIDFTCYEPKSLKRRVTRAMNIFECDSIHALWMRLLKEQGLINQFVNELTINLTSLFRDPRVWKRLSSIVTELAEKNDRVNVWHAGCSTGEEIISFQILLKELGLTDKFRVVASDINSSSIRQARSGNYHSMKEEEFRKNYRLFNSSGSLDKYMTVGEESLQFNTDLLKKVSFVENNLIMNSAPGQFHLIFCRNVMIYFDYQAKKKVLDKFYDHLFPEGFLVIGFFDALVPHIDKERFDFYDLSNKIFRKN